MVIVLNKEINMHYHVFFSKHVSTRLHFHKYGLMIVCLRTHIKGWWDAG